MLSGQLCRLVGRCASHLGIKHGGLSSQRDTAQVDALPLAKLPVSWILGARSVFAGAIPTGVETQWLEG